MSDIKEVDLEGGVQGGEAFELDVFGDPLHLDDSFSAPDNESHTGRDIPFALRMDKAYKEVPNNKHTIETLRQENKELRIPLETLRRRIPSFLHNEDDPVDVQNIARMPVHQSDGLKSSDNQLSPPQGLELQAVMDQILRAGLSESSMARLLRHALDQKLQRAKEQTQKMG
jgi:hypothetical protein